MKYNKLVRDKILNILEKKGISFESHTASQREYEEKLKEKLLEEVNEYLEDSNVEELADILEVVYALSVLHNSDKDELEKVREKKLRERGGFKKKIILDKTDD